VKVTKICLLSLPCQFVCLHLILEDFTSICHNIPVLEYEVLMAASTKIAVFWVVASHSLV
jgi:hypothetical protein